MAGRERAAESKNAVRGELQLLKCAKRLEQFSTARFRDGHGGSLSRFDVLANLQRSPGHSLPTSELAASLIASRGNITRLLVSLTNAGEDTFQRMATDHQHSMGEIFGVLGATETRQLIRLLAKIRARIELLDESGD